MLLVIALLYFLVSISTNVNSFIKTLPVQIQGSTQQIADSVAKGVAVLGEKLAEEISEAISSISTDADDEEQSQSLDVQPKQSDSLMNSAEQVIDTGGQLVEDLENASTELVEWWVEALLEGAIDSIENTMSREAESETASKSRTAETSGSDISISESVLNIATEEFV